MRFRALLGAAKFFASGQQHSRLRDYHKNSMYEVLTVLLALIEYMSLTYLPYL